MKKFCILMIFSLFLLCTLSGCLTSGPYSAPLTQPMENVVNVEFLDGRKEDDLFENINYDDLLIYTLTPEETVAFMEGLQGISFYMPNLEPSRHLGMVAARIYYKDGCSDIIGDNCHYYIGPQFEVLDRGVRFPDEQAFYNLFEQFVDPKLLPKRD